MVEHPRLAWHLILESSAKASLAHALPAPGANGRGAPERFPPTSTGRLAPVVSSRQRPEVAFLNLGFAMGARL